jgi:hypothetical protein
VEGEEGQFAVRREKEMRFRNTKQEGGEFAGNKRPALLGHNARRLFVPMDSARLFEQAPLGDKFPTLRTVGDDGQIVDTPIQPRNAEVAQWELPENTIAATDTIPPENEPEDVRIGGVNRPSTTDRLPANRYTVTGSTISRSLDVTAPTAANCAQVLSALLGDLETRRIVSKG